MEVYPQSWIVFVSFVLIATFVMVNLVIAIVVEAMNKITKEEEEHIIGSIETAQNATKHDIQKLEEKIEKLTKLLDQKSK
jgi:voltage-gated sodium channel